METTVRFQEQQSIPGQDRTVIASSNTSCQYYCYCSYYYDYCCCYSIAMVAVAIATASTIAVAIGGTISVTSTVTVVLHFLAATIVCSFLFWLGCF